MNKREKVLLALEKGYSLTDDELIIGARGSVLSIKHDSGGYRLFQFKHRGKTTNVYYHDMVAYQKFGELLFAEGTVVRHLDGDKANNSFENIHIGTHSDNMMDIKENTRRKKALVASSFVRKYNREEVKEFYNKNGWANTLKHFKISSKGTLSFILNG